MFINQQPQTEIYGLTPGHANLVDDDTSTFFLLLSTVSAHARLGFLGLAEAEISPLFESSTCHFRLRIPPLLEGITSP